MKCKICGGTGISNTCVNGTFKPCTFCDGTGEYEPFYADVELDKLDSEPQTNEEWLHTLNTEQLAEFLNLIIRVGPYENEPKDFWECVYGRGGDRGTKSIVEWLKQPHTKE